MMKLDTLDTCVHPADEVASVATSVADLFERRVQVSAKDRAWREKQDGRWVDTTWAEFDERASAIATWLLHYGVAYEEPIVIIGRTRSQWCLSDIAGQLAGAVTVGTYPTLSPDQLAYIVDHCGARVVFVEGAAEVRRLRKISDQCPTLERMVVWDMEGVEAEPDIVPFAELLRTTIDHDALIERRQRIQPDDVAIIVYTSGTTGPPKGARLTQRNILTVLRNEPNDGFCKNDHSLAFLPMAHVAERIVGFYTRVSLGLSTAFASSMAAVLDELQEVRPTLFGAVPRIFEKAYERIQAQVDVSSFLRQRIFRWAQRVGLEVVDRWERSTTMGWGLRAQYRWADRLVYRKIRAAFGGRVRFFITGAAPIPLPVLRFFWAIGLRIFEAYGQTESTAVTHCNRPGATRLGSVGRAVTGVECRLAPDNEILIRGTQVFKGYYRDDAATKETINEQGWLHTGDIGRIEDGYLYIVDRKKHIIITAGGKNITPANIENKIKVQDSLISNVHVHGDRRPYVSALVTLSPSYSIDWANEQGMIGDPDAQRLRAYLRADPLAELDELDALVARLSQARPVQQRIVEAVRAGNRTLSKVERVKRIVLLPREFSLARDELTPTVKVKRNRVEALYADSLDRLYRDETFGLLIERPAIEGR